jgi:Flp pilus assembly protein TadD
MRGHVGASIAECQGVLARRPDDLDLRCNFANALLEAGRGDQGLACLREARGDRRAGRPGAR